MTLQTTVTRVTAAPAPAQATKLSSGWMGTFSGLCMLIGLTLLYLPAIFPFVAVSFALRVMRAK